VQKHPKIGGDTGRSIAPVLILVDKISIQGILLYIGEVRGR